MRRDVHTEPHVTDTRCLPLVLVVDVRCPYTGDVSRRRSVLTYVFMLSIRLTPLPWVVKERILFLLTPKVVATALALIPDAHGRVLLLRSRYAGRWQLPGGNVQRGEHPLSAVQRECQEELGHTITLHGLSGVGAEAGGWLHFIFDCEPLLGPPRLSAEHEAYRYAAWEEVPPRLRHVIVAGRLALTESSIAGMEHVGTTWPALRADGPGSSCGPRARCTGAILEE